MFSLNSAKVITVEMYYCCKEGLAIFITRLVFEMVVWVIIFLSVYFITFFTLKLDFKMLFLCLESTSFAISKSQTLHFLVSWTFIRCCLKMIPLLKVFSHFVHFDSFLLWCSLKCLWKCSELLKAFPHSGRPDIICPFRCSWLKGFDATELSSTQKFCFQRLVALS